MSRNTQKENPARVSLAPASLPLALVPPETGAGFGMPWHRRAHISQHMAKDPHEEGTVPPPACVLLQGLVALGLFVVALLLVWGVCHWFFFPRLETKKTQEGEKMRKKKNPSLVCPTLSKHRFASTPFKFHSGGFYPFLHPRPLSLYYQLQQHKSLSLLLLCEHPRVGAGWGCRALLCPELLLHSHPLSCPHLTPGQKRAGHRPCPLALQLSLWPTPLAKSSQALPAKPALLGLCPQTATRMFQTLPNPSPTPTGLCLPWGLSQGQIPGSSAQEKKPWNFFSFQPISSL